MVGLWMMAFVVTIVGGILTIRDHKRSQEERMLLLQDQRRMMMDHLIAELELTDDESSLLELLLSYELVFYADVDFALGLSRDDARAMLMGLRTKIVPLGLNIVSVLVKQEVR